MKPTYVTTGIPREIVDSLNEIILDRSLASTMESVSEQVKQLEGVVRDNRKNTENVRSAIIQLKDRVDNQSFNSSEIRDQMVYSLGGASQGSPRSKSTSREREVVRKGTERMQKQISQLISVFISQEQMDIALLKKCKTFYVPVVYTAI